MINPDIYKVAFHKSHEILILADCDFRVLDANETAQQLLNYRPEEIKNREIQELFFEPDQGKQFTKDICKRNNVINWEYQLKTKDGKPVPTLINGDKIEDSEGIYLLSAQNHTEIKKETLAFIRKNELTATKSMTHLFVHEIKNLCNNTSLAAGDLESQMDEMPASFSGNVSVIQENTDRLKKIIHTLLEFDKGFDLQLKERDFNKILLKAVTENEKKMRRSGICLQFTPSTAPFLYPVDEEKIQMALNNIINNAIESIGHSDGAISISSQHANQKLIVRIADNGSGISDQEQQKLFKPYYTTKPEGNGIGLYTSREIFLEHQIGFHLESDRDSGSTFTLYFDKKNETLLNPT